MNFHRVQTFFICAAVIFTPLLTKAAVVAGHTKLSPQQLVPGAQVDLTGEWLYKPGYQIATQEQPQNSTETAGYVRVAVPQFLNRIHWWLDDSEDFKKAETARLAKLGFDTDRAEDGWYRLVIDLPQLQADRRLFLQFDGVAMKCEVFCNGQRLGEHAGMFSRFEFDLTQHLKQGRNVLAVFVSMEKIPTSTLSQGTAVTVNLTASKVMTMSKGMFGPLSPGFDNRAYDLHGIWQPVKLVARGAAKLDDVWFISSTNAAVVRVEASSSTEAQPAVLQAEWIDKATGETFARTQPSDITLSQKVSLHAVGITSVSPKLWTPATPHLYQLNVTLWTPAGELLDSWSHNVGFRTFEVRGNKLFLNGQPWWLRGANHLPYGKNPWDPQLPRKLIQLLHDANVRVTRTHATPWNETWLDAADEIGLGVSIEGIRPWALAGKIGATPPDLFQHWLMENEDVIRRCRNHPSVLIYTVGNEMMLRDSTNPEKWKQLSDLVKQTRKLDPTRPVICSSEYHREKKVFDSVIKPNGFDDGDADDVHRYFGWYRESPFVLESLFDEELTNPWNRPFIGQEISTGYPDLDSGLPVLRYTRDLLTPQAWIGHYAYPGHDPSIFLDHYQAVTKRLAEQLRFQRGDKTAGFMLFATECWFRHSFDAKTVKPYSVVEAMKEAFAPVGVALETRRRRFFPGEQIETAVFVTNDDEQFRNLSNLSVTIEMLDHKRTIMNRSGVGEIASLAYYETKRVPIRIAMPKGTGERRRLQLIVRVMSGETEVARTTENIDVIAAPGPVKLNATVVTQSLGPELQRFLENTVTSSRTDNGVLLVGADANGALDEHGQLRNAIEAGATAIWFSPGMKSQALFPADIIDVKPTRGEYADWMPAAGTTFADQLQPMDLKWWARKNEETVFVASSSHRLDRTGKARELIRFIPAHSYIPAEKVPEQYRTILFEIAIGKGRLWICDLDLDASVGVDPLAQRFAVNLLRAAADPSSTRRLPKVPTHEEMLKGKRIK